MALGLVKLSTAPYWKQSRLLLLLLAAGVAVALSGLACFVLAPVVGSVGLQ